MTPPPIPRPNHGWTVEEKEKVIHLYYIKCQSAKTAAFQRPAPIYTNRG